MKKFGVILLALITAGLSFAYFSWKQATKLPEWYSTNETVGQKHNSTGKLSADTTEEVLEFAVQPTTETTSKPATSKTNVNSSKSAKVKLNKNELNELVVSKVSKSVGTDKAVKGSNTTIKNGRVESGVVVSVSEISASKLEQKQKAAIEKAIRAFPALKDKDIYVGIEGKPKVKDGQLMFDDNTKIKLGSLSLTMAELSSRLGIPKDSLERSISLEIKKLKIDES